MKKFWLALILSTQIVLVGCATHAWNKYSIDIPPDNNCSMGSPEGFTRYYIWKCLDNKRVVVSQTSSIFARFSANRYESSCGSLTEIEIKLSKANYSLTCENAGGWQTINPQRDGRKL